MNKLNFLLKFSVLVATAVMITLIYANVAKADVSNEIGLEISDLVLAEEIDQRLTTIDLIEIEMIEQEMMEDEAFDMPNYGRIDDSFSDFPQ